MGAKKENLQISKLIKENSLFVYLYNPNIAVNGRLTKEEARSHALTCTLGVHCINYDIVIKQAATSMQKRGRCMHTLTSFQPVLVSETSIVACYPRTS